MDNEKFKMNQDKWFAIMVIGVVFCISACSAVVTVADIANR